MVTLRRHGGAEVRRQTGGGDTTATRRRGGAEGVSTRGRWGKQRSHHGDASPCDGESGIHVRRACVQAGWGGVPTARRGSCVCFSLPRPSIVPPPRRLSSRFRSCRSTGVRSTGGRDARAPLRGVVQARRKDAARLRHDTSAFLPLRRRGAAVPHRHPAIPPWFGMRATIVRPPAIPPWFWPPHLRGSATLCGSVAPSPRSLRFPHRATVPSPCIRGSAPAPP